MPFRKYFVVLVFNVGSSSLERAHTMSRPDFTSYAAGMDAPGCGGMNRLGGGMSGGAGFGGMDNLGSIGSFGGRMAGKFFIWQ